MKTYFIGADVDSKMTEIAFECDGKIVRRRRVATSIAAIREVLAQVNGRKLLTFEEGPMADWLYRHLADAVDEVLVCDPRRNRLIVDDGDKDDPIDAGKLAILRRGDFLRAVHHSASVERVELKQWVGLYHDRVREAVRQVNKIRAAGRRYLVRIPGRVLRRAKLRAGWLAEQNLAALAEQLQMLWLGYDAVARQVRLARSQLARRAKDLAMVRAWQELPGVGLIRAITFYAYVDTPWRFRSCKAICKYCGVGLLRTESQLIGRTGYPSEDELYATYRKIVDGMYPHSVIIRVFDVGGDKIAPGSFHESNPFLGWRGIRVLLDRPELFLTQLRAILRASDRKTVRIMVPMVSTVREIMRTKEMVEQAKKDLAARGEAFDPSVKLGIMVETPAAAVLVDVLAEASDFSSLGTNDLTQYTLAVDRGNAKVSGLFQPLHPAVLRLIRQTIDGGHAKGKWVGMCGELAGMTKAIPILLGLGLDEFSMNPRAIPEAKHLIGALTDERAQQIANEVMSMRTAAEIETHMKEVLGKI